MIYLDVLKNGLYAIVSCSQLLWQFKHFQLQMSRKLVKSFLYTQILSHSYQKVVVRDSVSSRRSFGKKSTLTSRRVTYVPTHLHKELNGHRPAEEKTDWERRENSGKRERESKHGWSIFSGWTYRSYTWEILGCHDESQHLADLMHYPLRREYLTSKQQVVFIDCRWVSARVQN